MFFLLQQLQPYIEFPFILYYIYIPRYILTVKHYKYHKEKLIPIICCSNKIMMMTNHYSRWLGLVVVAIVGSIGRMMMSTHNINNYHLTIEAYTTQSILYPNKYTKKHLLSKSKSNPTTTTVLYDVAWVPTDDGSGISYSERSRPYRRDVFAYDDWVRHRSTERFTGRLSKLGKSGIVRALSYEVQLLAAVATFICLFNALCVTGYDDFSYVHHDPLINIGLPVLSLPSMFFTLSSPALSLLLGMLLGFSF
jgi:hypothetical protein